MQLNKKRGLGPLFLLRFSGYVENIFFYRNTLPNVLYYKVKQTKCGRKVHLLILYQMEVSLVSQKKDKNEINSWEKSIVLYLHDLIYMLMTILLVFLICFRVIVVSGDSMYSTLLDGDYLLLLGNLFYHEPQQGDIVVISKQNYDNGKPIVKRVIATEGQTVDIDFKSGTVYVDGIVLKEDYINNPTTDNRGMEFPLVVEENCIFVLGDNRSVSLDSRSPHIGQIDEREVLGKAIYLMIPGTSHGDLPQNYDRTGVIR